jgi:hypothetical protein
VLYQQGRIIQKTKLDIVLLPPHELKMDAHLPVIIITFYKEKKTKLLNHLCMFLLALHTLIEECFPISINLRITILLKG